MTKCMSYQEGEIDSPFSLQNQVAYCVSTCKVQILMQATQISVFLNVFYKNINYLCLRWKRLNEHRKASSWDFNTSNKN